MLPVGTVMDIPLLTAPLGSTFYQVLFDNGTSASIPLADMPSLILAPPLPLLAPTYSLSDNSSFAFLFFFYFLDYS